MRKLRLMVVSILPEDLIANIHLDSNAVQVLLALKPMQALKGKEVEDTGLFFSKHVLQRLWDIYSFVLLYDLSLPSAPLEFLCLQNSNLSF